MSTCTAELILGKADQNHSGIQFDHRLTLYENSRPVLIMERKPSLANGGSLIDRWVPHPNKILDDCMVMLAGYGIGDKAVLLLINDMKKDNQSGDILDLTTVNDKLMANLYDASRQAFRIKVNKTGYSISADRWKVMACIFRFSSILNSVELLNTYDIDVEICQSVYQSEYSTWNGEINTWGELK